MFDLVRGLSAWVLLAVIAFFSWEASAQTREDVLKELRPYDW